MSLDADARPGACPLSSINPFDPDLLQDPYPYFERLRLEAARLRVESTAEPIDRVAEAAGFGDPERMRRAFLRAFGQPPQALRRAARA